MWTIVLAGAIVTRGSRLITTDTVPFARLRAAVIRRWGAESLPGEGIRCTWCVSLWLATATTAAAWWYADHVAFQLVGLVCLLSLVAGVLDRYS